MSFPDTQKPAPRKDAADFNCGWSVATMISRPCLESQLSGPKATTDTKCQAKSDPASATLAH